MSRVNTGGPAFPCPEDQTAFRTQGMTLRDYFAAKVAVGLMSEYWNSERRSEPTFEVLAKEAYAFADEMLKARGK